MGPRGHAGEIVTVIAESRDPSALPGSDSSLACSGGLIIILSVITLALGLGVQVGLAAQLGTSRAMDAYLVAITLPTLGAAVAVTVFPSALVPVLRGPLADGDSGHADSIFRLAFLLSAALGLVAAIGVSLGAAFVVQITAPGLAGADAETATGLLRVTAFGLVFDIPRGVLTARQYALQRYLAPQAAPSLNHLILLGAALVLLPRLGLGAMAAAWTAGSAAMLALLMPSALRPLARPGVHTARWSSLAGLPAVLAVSVLVQATPVVDRWVASSLPEGAIAALGYGNKILEVLMRTIPMGVGLVLFPILSEHAARERWADFRQAAAKAGRWLWLGAVPLALLVVMFREAWVVLLFERGGFDRGSSLAVADGLLWYGLAFLPAGAVYLLAHAHYAMKDTRPLLWAGLFSLLGTLLLDVLLARWWGFPGVAAASLLINTFVGLYLASPVWKTKLFPPTSTRPPVAVGRLVASLLMVGILAVASRWTSGLMDDRVRLASLVGMSGALSLILYLGTLIALRDPEARSALRRARAWITVGGIRGARKAG